MLSPNKKYKSALFQVTQDVDKALQSIQWNPKSKISTKQLWKVSDEDACRLTRLLVWSERYGVPLAYVLETLLLYHFSVLPKDRKIRAKQSKGLGLRVATLTGPVSLEVLQEALREDFLDEDNIAAHKEEEKERIADLLDDELPRKSRGVLQFESISRFTTAYEREIKRRRDGVTRLQRKMGKIKWRGNPWL